MICLSIGMTSVKDARCKRGLAANVAAAVARGGDIRVCVVDADIHERDASVRFGNPLSARQTTTQSLEWHARHAQAKSRPVVVAVDDIHRTSPRHVRSTAS